MRKIGRVGGLQCVRLRASASGVIHSVAAERCDTGCQIGSAALARDESTVHPAETVDVRQCVVQRRGQKECAGESLTLIQLQADRSTGQQRSSLAKDCDGSRQSVEHGTGGAVPGRFSGREEQLRNVARKRGPDWIS